MSRMQAWRRRLKEATTKRKQSPTEIVLSFTQSEACVDDLETWLRLTKLRAMSRAHGLELMAANIGTLEAHDPATVLSRCNMIDRATQVLPWAACCVGLFAFHPPSFARSPSLCLPLLP